MPADGTLRRALRSVRQEYAILPIAVDELSMPTGEPGAVERIERSLADIDERLTAIEKAWTSAMGMILLAKWAIGLLGLSGLATFVILLSQQGK